MNMNKRYAFGFTIAELLITMLITMVVAAAMVPVIGLKKIKSPHVRHNHGIAECYYQPSGAPDQNGDYDSGSYNLKYYFADNGSNRNGQTSTINGRRYCTFNVPEAEYYEIIAIGPGTDGSSSVPTFNVSDQKLLKGPVPIPVDNGYQGAISSATITAPDGTVENISSQLIRLLNEWSAKDPGGNELYAYYWAESPIGTGGAGACFFYARTSNSNNCKCNADDGYCPGPISGYFGVADKDDITDGRYGTDKCFAYISQQGQNSGRGVRTSPLKVRLSGSTVISSVTNNTSQIGLKLRGGIEGNHEFWLNSSPNGANASVVNNYDFGYININNPVSAQCTGDLCGRMNITSDPGMINEGARSGVQSGRSTCPAQAGAGPTPGHLYFSPNLKDTDPNKLEWRYIGVDANTRTGTKGEPGEQKSVIYEKLKGKLYMFPAPYNGQNINARSYVQETLGDNSTNLISAKSGQNVGRDNVPMTFRITTAVMPFPQEPLDSARADNKNFTYMTKVRSTRFGGGIVNCENNASAPWCPGYAGNGTYFLFKQLPLSNALYVYNKYSGKSYTTPYETLLTKNKADRSVCYDDITPARSLGIRTYQKLGGGTESFEPFYCREPKAKGSPGAIIIIW